MSKKFNCSNCGIKRAYFRKSTNDYKCQDCSLVFKKDQIPDPNKSVFGEPLVKTEKKMSMEEQHELMTSLMDPEPEPTETEEKPDPMEMLIDIQIKVTSIQENQKVMAEYYERLVKRLEENYLVYKNKEPQKTEEPKPQFKRL